MNRPAPQEVLSGIAEVLEAVILPATSGDRARQQCRLAMLAVRRVAGICEMQRQALLEEQLDLKASLELIQEALGDSGNDLAMSSREEIGRALVVAASEDDGTEGLWVLTDTLVKTVVVATHDFPDVVPRLLAQLTRRSLDRWIEVVPFAASIGDWSPLDPVGLFS